uniref:Protein TsetseEP domain-containing protein n=1 Tax=Anopheles culicifacies TaxID=139723 RepID=A0A182MUS1_9DIPT
MFPKAVLVFVLVSFSGCLTVPVSDPLDYLPTLEYLRNVLRFSILSLSQVKPDPALPLTLDIPQTLRNVSHSFTNAQAAVEKISELLQTQDMSSNMEMLAENLQQINCSFSEVNIHYPEYYRKENGSQELDLLRRNMSEHLKRVDFKKPSLAFDDLREINSFLTDATSHVMSTTVAVFLISSVEQLEYYLRVVYFPPHMEAMELKDLHDTTQIVRSYHELYRAALRTASERFLQKASAGRQLLKSVPVTSTSLPEDLHKGVAEFSNHVDNFIRTGLEDLQSVEYRTDNRFGEALQNILYTSYGLVSSGMAMLHPYVRHLQCVRELIPRSHTVAALSLMSVSLCSNEATTTLYDTTMMYHEKIRELQYQIFEQLQKVGACTKLEAGNCSSVYDETMRLINANIEEVKQFKIDFEPYREQLLNCQTSKYEIEMAKVLEMSLNFDECVKTSK